MSKVTVSFTLDSERDRRVLRYLQGLPWGEKSAAIRQALEAHLGTGDVTLGDVYQAVKDLEHKIGREFVRLQAGCAEDSAPPLADEPADVAANLDSLGL